MYRSILVPLDGSSLGEQALPLAYEVAQRAGATLHLVHVHHPTGTPVVVEGLPVIDEELHSLAEQHERAYLERLREELADGSVQANVAVLTPDEPPDESVAHVLMEYAATHEIDLIVMATHGRGGLARAWLGSVADALVRQFTLPVLLVRPGEGQSEPKSFALDHVLIPLDGSPLAEQAIGPALELGRLFDSDYTLLRGVEPFILPGYSPIATVHGLEQRANEEARAEALAYLNTVAGRLVGAELTVRTHVVMAAQPAACILDEAERYSDGLIALTTHGRTGLRRILLGSVADKVVRGAKVPVLLYRPVEQ